MKKFLKSLVSVAMIAAMAISMVACSTKAPNAPGTTGSTAATSAPGTTASGAPANDKKYADTITIVWYPNESASDYKPAREKLYSYIEQATGKEVVERLTTDYAIAIEAIASGTAQIGALMGAVGYIQAKDANDAVDVLLVNSGASGTLDDARYFSWLCVNKGEEQNYMKDGKYAIDNIVGKRIAFVSNSSTSGFKVPTTNIIGHFSGQDKWKSLDADALVEGGPDKFFSEVLFGNSHQGSAVHLLSGKADVAAFCDTELVNYSSPVSGDELTVGSVWKVDDDASSPFDTLRGKEFVLIAVTPVLNGPWAYNGDTLSPDDVKAIRDLFTSDTLANDPEIFVPADSKFKGTYKKTKNEKFVLVEDSWYDVIRNMGN